jgi:hypothetical protein
MTDEWIPWERYPGLTLDKLLVTADIVRQARTGAAEDHHPEKFETNWSLGVSGYERTCGQLTWSQQEYPWLCVTSGAGGGPVHFVMTVAGHAMRFYRGEPDEIPTRYKTLSFPELIELQKAHVLNSSLAENRGLRLAVDLDRSSGMPTDIYLVEMDEPTGNPINVFLIPARAHSTTVIEFTPQGPPAVELPPVSAEAIEGEAEEKKDKTGSDDD